MYVKRLFLDELILDIDAMPPMPLCGRCQLQWCCQLAKATVRWAEFW